MQPQLLGQMLLEGGFCDVSALEQALRHSNDSPGERLGAIMIRLGLISEQTLLFTLSRQLQVPIFDDGLLGSITPLVIAWHQKMQISQAMAIRMAFFAYEKDDSSVAVVTRDVLDSSLLEYLETGPCKEARSVHLFLVTTRDLERMHGQIYRPRGGADLNEDLRRLAEDAPVVELVNGVMARATDTRASDVHIEPEEFGFAVRYRIDGQLQGAEQYPRDRFDAVVSRIKLVSGLDIAERRMPQDGRFSTRTSGVDTDVRVSVIPGVLGESLVMRLLPNTQNTRFDLNNLGMEEDHLALYRNWMANPDGIILVTGPTGSGKSTTLYATLVASNTAHERVLTVEDPVEYQIPGVTQFQVHPEIGFTFPAALRSILRHDPDTIMIGEIRDVETARIAVQSSLTGHRVFSTLHTNDSATAFLRLADMGVEPFLVGATVRGVVAQRLVRRLCQDCAVPMHEVNLLPVNVRKSLDRMHIDIREVQFMEPRGCPACNGTGYRGRIAVYELFAATDQLRAVLNQPAPSLESLLHCASTDFRCLRDDALLKAARGLSSLEEVYAMAGGIDLRGEKLEAR